MEVTLPLNDFHVSLSSLTINRTHMILHSIALLLLIHYRITFFFQQDPTSSSIPLLPWLLVFASELLLSFIWFLGQAYRWRPVSRTVYPERLPEDAELPAVDVFICTADPDREPSFLVMNTVLSAMALDYPPEKLHVYLSDDGGSLVTLRSLRETWEFGKCWLPFCKRYQIQNRCPMAFFESLDNDHEAFTEEFIADKKFIKEKLEILKCRIEKIKEQGGHVGNDASKSTSRDHPAVVEIIKEYGVDSRKEECGKMPRIVYVAREKRSSHHHQFKGGALNVLHRVSGIISNSPYILVLDCDMYCNDPSSARRAMCFHLDPNMSPKLSFVQFPQRFRHSSRNEIYDSQMRSIFKVLWRGIDGLLGPGLCGSNFYIKRTSLCGSYTREDFSGLKQSFGSSSEFIKSLFSNHTTADTVDTNADMLVKETELVASCNYENGTEWGKEVGFFYSVVEDYLTGFTLHCKGWISVYHDPQRAQFLGSGMTSLDDLLVAHTRWTSGILDVAFSKYCPLIYGPPRMSLLESMCYSEGQFSPTCYSFSLWILASVPQICLLNGTYVYPKVTSLSFLTFSCIFLSATLKHLYEVLATGSCFKAMVNEQRNWMIVSITSNFYGSLDGLMKLFGIRKASFLPSNKVKDVKQLQRYQKGIFDFQTSAMFLCPMVMLITLNMVAFVIGAYKTTVMNDWESAFVQIFLCFYILIVNLPVMEGMVRKDQGRIPLSISLFSMVISMSVTFGGYVLFM